jgi:rod shape-determining protein MreC
MLVRYRNITTLLLTIFAQLVLLAYQVKNASDVRMIRVWAVTAVTPFAKMIEIVRSGTVGFVESYVTLRDARAENRRIQAQLDKLKMENHFLKNELNTAERAKALAAFQSETQSKTLAARIIGMGAGFNSKVVFVDRGSLAGVEKGMAVVTPDGIVGKVLAAYPLVSQVMLITDPNFAAGVISQVHHVRGTLKGQDYANCKVDYVQNEEKVDIGELVYTSGDDRIFPKGFPVGIVRVVRPGSGEKEIYVEPSGLRHGLEEVLILIEGVHQAIPEMPLAANAPIYLAPAPPAGPASASLEELNKTGLETDADRLRARYMDIGAAQGHKFGEGLPGSKPPDFNIKVNPAGVSDRETGRRGDGAAEPSPVPARTAAPPRTDARSPFAQPGQVQKKGVEPASPSLRPPVPPSPTPPRKSPEQNKLPERSKPTSPVDPFL